MQPLRIQDLKSFLHLGHNAVSGSCQETSMSTSLPQRSRVTGDFQVSPSESPKTEGTFSKLSEVIE